MKNIKIRSTYKIPLRRRAEKKVKNLHAKSNQRKENLTDEKAQTLIHELEVHQIELSMQNENLRDIQKDLEVSKARYSDLYNFAPVGYCTLTKRGFILEANLTLCKMLGVYRNEVINKNIFSFIDPKSSDLLYLLLVQSFEQMGSRKLCEIKFLVLGKLPFWAQVEVTVIEKSGGKKDCLAIISDITDQKLAQDTIFIEREQFKTTLMSVGEGIISTDNFGDILIMNEAAEKFTGWNFRESSGKTFTEVFVRINNENKESCENPIKEVIETGKPYKSSKDVVLISKDGSRRFIEETAAPIKDEQEIIRGVVYTIRDQTPIQKELEKNIFLSFHDQLTGLYNRRFFEEELKRLDVARNLPLALVFFDVNRLKIINDVFGHVSGDKLLIKVSEILKKECREDDIISRIGGDEFVIILPKTDLIETELFANRVEAKFENYQINNIELSVSLGFDIKVDINQDIAIILQNAENNMYRQKLSERQSIHFNTITMIMKILFEENIREEEHAKSVSKLSAMLAENLGLSKSKIEEIEMLGLMHDIGKVSISQDILNKDSSLNEAEWIEIKRHSEIGFNILKSVPEYLVLVEFVLSIHERWDGLGYPRGLKDIEIPLESRIIAIVDAFDSMTSHRPYRDEIDEKSALLELEKNSGTQFDPELVKVFIEVVTRTLESRHIDNR